MEFINLQLADSVRRVIIQVKYIILVEIVTNKTTKRDEILIWVYNHGRVDCALTDDNKNALHEIKIPVRSIE